MEVELKFQVPQATRSALRRAVATRSAQRTRLQAIYADTADDRLAAAGLALRLRKEGRVWVQTLKGRGDGLMQRLEHEVPLPAQRGEPALDPGRHAGTPVGEQLLRVLSAEQTAAAASGPGVGSDGSGGLAPLYRTDIQRLHRTLSHAGARIELALDEGWILAGGQRQPVFEIEFELKSGPPAALVSLALRWVQRFGLVWDVRTKSERGFRLARGLQHVPAVRAPAVAWPRDEVHTDRRDKKPRHGARASSKPGASPAQAWSALLVSALGQVLPNAAELACEQRHAPGHAKADTLRADAAHLHQLRVGLRRLRTVLGLCAAWGPDEAAAHALQAAWREPFVQLGAARDGDVLGGGLWPEIQAAGGPDTPAPRPSAARLPAPPEPAALLRQPGFSLLLLQTLALSLSAAPTDADAGQAGLHEGPHEGPHEGLVEGARQGVHAGVHAGKRAGAQTGVQAGAQTGAQTGGREAWPEPANLPAAAAHVLRRTWRQVRRDADGFEALALEQQHRTRRRLKRLRYLLEGLLALPGALPWPRDALRLWHRRLCRALDALGRFNDLCMADEALAAVAAAAPSADPGVWFARGWLSVQRPLAMAAAAQRLHRLVQTPTPWPKAR